MIPLTSDGESTAFAVSQEGLALLMENLGDRCNRLDEVGLLQVAMTKDRRIADNVKQQLLFGLLLSRRLIVIKEDGVVISPVPEIRILTFQVSTTFIPPPLLEPAPDLSTICHWKQLCPGVPAHHIVWLILESLNDSNDLKEFRLKSYSSVMNKLFYRGGDLSDLFATTVTVTSYRDLKKKLLGKQVIAYESTVNGNGCQVYRYQRGVAVSIDGIRFNFSAFYEVVVDNHRTPNAHEIYELNRLHCGIADYSVTLRAYGFDIEEVM